MSFLYPAFLIGALAVAIPLVLHLLRRDVAPEVPFTAVRLLRRAPVERSRRRRLRDLLLLAARAAALLLLAAAFARPYVASPVAASLRLVAIDRSFSMSAPGQFERALEAARQAVNEAGPSEPVAVIAFDERADILAAPGSASDARAALDGLAPGFGATRYDALVEKLADFAGAGGTLVIVSDLQRTGLSDSVPLALPPGWRVAARDLGPPPGNLAIAEIEVRPDRLLAIVRNGWNDGRRSTVRVRHGITEIAASPVSLDAGSSTVVTIPLRIPASGALAVTVEDPGGIAADDTRYHVLGDAAQPRALIVAPAGGPRQPAFYLASALETGPEERGFSVEVVRGVALSKVPDGGLEDRSVVILISTRGLDRRVRDGIARWTRAGGGLWLVAAPELEGAVVSRMFEWEPALAPGDIEQAGLTFAATDPRHPIFRPFGALLANLGSVRFSRIWEVHPDGWHVLARFSNGRAALLERAEGRGRVVLFASDLERRWNDFPLHPSFLPFVIETARHAAGGELPQVQLSVADAPPGVPARPGVYPLGGSRGSVAINVDPRESETDKLDMEEFGRRFLAGRADMAPAVPLHAQQAEAAQGYWRFGLLLMLAALVAESVIGRAGR